MHRNSDLQHLLEMTQYHSPMQAATSAPALLPVQMGPNTLESEAQQIAQQRWMMQQQMMNLSLPADSTNHPPFHSFRRHFSPRKFEWHAFARKLLFRGEIQRINA
jgi:hypothetical protein